MYMKYTGNIGGTYEERTKKEKMKRIDNIFTVHIIRLWKRLRT